MNLSAASTIFYSLVGTAVVAFAVIVWKYARGLKESPRDMWFMFGYKVIEYSAYAAMNMTLSLWLVQDCGFTDIGRGEVIMAWSMMLSIMAMISGALVDTIGIKKTLLISIFFLFISRVFMAFITNPIAVFTLGFVPLAIGFAIVAPVVSVAIKRYTTKEGATLGFGLFYVVMNAAYAVGGWFFDFVRTEFAAVDAAGKVINENAGTVILGHHFTTYQMFFVFGALATLVSFICVLMMRSGVEVTDDGKTLINPIESKGSGLAAIGHAAVGVGKKIHSSVSEKHFWIFMGMIGITVFVRTIFFHLHYTFPPYGLRVLGEGAKIGNVYGVLNPVLIIFLVPLVAAFTKKVNSYKMLVVGSIISSLSCFMAIVPGSIYEPLTNSVLGEMVFVNWLGLASDMPSLIANPPSAEYWTLIVFFIVFTIGESIWSPRLMQFTAEIAPKGKEGTYISLSVLPFFLAKFIVGPMSGWLVGKYTPLDAGKVMASYPEHHMVWVWVGAMGILTPIGLMIFRKSFTKHG